MFRTTADGLTVPQLPDIVPGNSCTQGQWWAAIIKI